MIYKELFTMNPVDFKTSSSFLSGFFLVFLIFLLSSCGSSTKDIVYFDGVHDVTLKTKYPPNVESPIQLNDLLSIIVSSANPQASSIFNAPNESTPITSSATSSSNTLTVGYLVNLNGDLQFPVLGKIHAQGLTKTQLQTLLTRMLIDTKQLVDPIVTIRQLNFRVSVLGEVTKPGVFSTPNEKISLLEALSFAGDITIYGKKDNVLLIREDDKGDKLIVRIDLTSRDLFTSPYYYLKSNDVLYIEPSKNREKKERFAQMTPIILSVISLAIIIVNAIQYRN
ncbi:MAG TPA: polysaccharide biosynthesis/export family protein [Chitinophagaceae bacterium]|nr:polysaccharide biosynthesis/export family protein [Chitinophagaceae bacterium]